jgi:hypothetical protein
VASITIPSPLQFYAAAALRLVLGSGRRERSPMTDFYPMVLAAVAKLDPNTQEARQALYQRARAALADRLRDLEPPLSEQRIMEERLAFEEAVRRAEADWARGLVEHELLSKLADAIEHDVSLADPPHRAGQAWIHGSGTLRQFRSGAQFEYTQDRAFVFAAMGTPADCATAADPLVRSIRSELEYKARDLVGRASRLSDRALWSSLIDPVRMFVEHIGGSEAAVAAGIGTLWALCVALGAHIDSQEDAESREIFVPPEADVLRAVRDLVATSGPWIHMFPTGRALDDQTRMSGAPPSEIVDAAATFLRSAEATALLRGEDAAILRAILDAGGSAGLARKARNWAVGTASNLGIAMLLVLSSIVRGYEKTADSADPTEIARRIERVVLRHEARLLQVFSHLPDDIRDELRMVIDAIRVSAADDV